MGILPWIVSGRIVHTENARWVGWVLRCDALVAFPKKRARRGRRASIEYPVRPSDMGQMPMPLAPPSFAGTPDASFPKNPLESSACLRAT